MSFYPSPTCKTIAASLAMLAVLGGCGGDNNNDATPVVIPTITLAATQSNAVAHWHDIGAATVNTPGAVAVTPEELRRIERLVTDMNDGQTASAVP